MSNKDQTTKSEPADSELPAPDAQSTAIPGWGKFLKQNANASAIDRVTNNGKTKPFRGGLGKN